MILAFALIINESQHIFLMEGSLSLSPMEENKDLSTLNTFGLYAKAAKFLSIESAEEAQAFFANPPKEEILILGGGSNILLKNDFKGIVVYNEIKGIHLESEDVESVLIRANAGENWHEFVMYCIDKGYAGVENLSLIPGKVGASPMQNIGAYGVEVKEVIESVEAVSTLDGSFRIFSNAECDFDYRSSVFKTSLKGQYFITSVLFRLHKRPTFKTSYGAIQDQLAKMGIEENELTIKAVSDAVIAIRQSKLPDPKEIGNSGSFFKNPIIDLSKYEDLKKQYPEMPAYPAKEGSIKVAAGWLIEQAGWKGFREGDYGVHQKQALVLVNYGNATGEEIYGLSERIIESVKEKFGISLEREVNII
jgi:UDP-N-acetylmuramate dehydrogenase